SLQVSDECKDVVGGRLDQLEHIRVLLAVRQAQLRFILEAQALQQIRVQPYGVSERTEPVRGRMCRWAMRGEELRRVGPGGANEHRERANKAREDSRHFLHLPGGSLAASS